MKFLKTFITLLAAIVFLCGFSSNALATPKLQLYIPGAEYDIGTKTWVYPGLQYELWAIGTMDSNESIMDVKLSAAVKSYQIGNINIQPILRYGSLGDPLAGVFFEDSTPVKSDLMEIPNDNNIYPSDFYVFDLGKFSPKWRTTYEIKKYNVEVTGGYDWVYFDLYDHIAGSNHAISSETHAADGGAPVPEPATLLLLGSGLIGLAGIGRKKFFKKA